MSCVVVTPNRV